jgi:hypothetical protein
MSKLVNTGLATIPTGTGGVTPGAISPEAATSKLFGQVMHTLRHAIAWRVNGFIGWEAP